MTGPNLLVVDWDFFFVNPLHNGNVTDRTLLLYDWKHLEAPFFVNDIWWSRLHGFVMNDLPLPMASNVEGFWDRFGLDEAVLMVADSNLYAGLIQPSSIGDFEAERWNRIDLFDAHHDSGYKIRSLAEYEQRGTVSCEDWMLEHAKRGVTDLHVHYPAWLTAAFSADPQPAIEIDRRIDDGQPVDVSYDAVFVCRSGAWVPPWCDQQFADFVKSFPGAGYSWVDEENETMVRDFDIEMATAQAEELKQALQGHGASVEALNAVLRSQGNNAEGN
jgi:hypothetical protein